MAESLSRLWTETMQKEVKWSVMQVTSVLKEGKVALEVSWEEEKEGREEGQAPVASLDR